jgi:hypothetical protein
MPCEVCGTEAVLVQDHDHDNGMNRGKVCRFCNLFLMPLEGDPELAQKALIYLQLYRDNPTGIRYADWKREQARASQRRYEQAHRAERRAYGKRYDHEHRAQKAERQRRWRAAHPEQLAAEKRRYRAHRKDRLSEAVSPRE